MHVPTCLLTGSENQNLVLAICRLILVFRKTWLNSGRPSRARGRASNTVTKEDSDSYGTFK